MNTMIQNYKIPPHLMRRAIPTQTKTTRINPLPRLTKLKSLPALDLVNLIRP